MTDQLGSINTLRRAPITARDEAEHGWGYPFEQRPSLHTLAEVGHAQLTTMCRTLGLNVRTATDVFDTLAHGWRNRSVGARPLLSDITDDNSPFEFSVALQDGLPELRMLTEAQAPSGRQDDHWEAAWEVNSKLQHKYGVSLDRLQRVAHLFQPTDDQAIFGLWHAVCLKLNGDLAFKVYLNPNAQGTGRAREATNRALLELGLTDAIAWLDTHALCSDSDRVLYFSLDLDDRNQTRTKIYIAHDNACAEDVERVMAAAPSHVPGDALRFCDAMVGNTGPFQDRPLITCAAFTGNQPSPQTVTLHLPVRCYAHNDEVVLQRICDFLPATDAALYEQLLRGASTRALQLRSGIQTYASFRRSGAEQRLTVYISPELYDRPVESPLSNS